eukprot:COSAG04_NODE_43_length_31842_cov_15.704848_26_plen_177_part_00
MGDGGAHEASYISARWSGVLPAESAARQAVGQLDAIKRMASARRKTGGRCSGVRPRLSCGRGAPHVSCRRRGRGNARGAADLGEPRLGAHDGELPQHGSGRVHPECDMERRAAVPVARQRAAAAGVVRRQVLAGEAPVPRLERLERRRRHPGQSTEHKSSGAGSTSRAKAQRRLLH